MTTVTPEQITELDEKAAEISYPAYVKALKELGVASYEVQVSGHDRVFRFNDGEELEVAGVLPEFICDKKLDEKALATTLKRMQLGLIDYQTFLAQIATAGVHSYVADLENMQVTYRGKKEGEEYVEKIPAK